MPVLMLLNFFIPCCFGPFFGQHVRVIPAALRVEPLHKFILCLILRLGMIGSAIAVLGRCSKEVLWFKGSFQAVITIKSEILQVLWFKTHPLSCDAPK